MTQVRNIRIAYTWLGLCPQQFLPFYNCTCCQKQKMEIVSLLIITDLTFEMPLKVDELQFMLVLGIFCQKAIFSVGNYINFLH